MTEIRDTYIKISDKISQGIQNSPSQNSNKVDFQDMLKSSVDKVNQLQHQSSEIKTQFELGDPNVKLADVMIAGEKAKIGFEAALQVRNKLIEAYQDVMNMPI